MELDEGMIQQSESAALMEALAKDTRSMEEAALEGMSASQHFERLSMGKLCCS